MFDWIRFLDSCGVEYILGPSGQVRRDHVGICCPRCGDDEKFHFNIDVESGKIRGCWRNGDHWMPPAQLISEVAQIPYASAKKMLEEDSIGEIKTESLKAQLEALDRKETKDELPLMQWPSEIQQLSAAAGTPSGRLYWEYMRNRGFSDPGAVGAWYGLKWCITGEWSHRILFPLKNWEGGLVGWTGRDVTGTSKIKYKTEPKGEGVAGLVFGYEPGMSGDTLCLVEGPMDALKLDYYAGSRKVHAVALLGLNAGKRKWQLIEKLSRDFKEVVICLDAGEDATAHALRDQLSVLSTRVVYVPEGVKDPGEMTKTQVEAWWDSVFV